jgi:hypothetical protein
VDSKRAVEAICEVKIGGHGRGFEHPEFRNAGVPKRLKVTRLDFRGRARDLDRIVGECALAPGQLGARSFGSPAGSGIEGLLAVLGKVLKAFDWLAA